MSYTDPDLQKIFEEWTTIEEAAEIVQRDRTVIRYWVETGKIACYPIGRRIRVVNIEEVKMYSEEVAMRKPGAGKRKVDNEAKTK
jgi:excisionase family DNA binding protein